MNRTMDERSGFYVMTPLRLPDGGAVVVQRGWIARDDADPMKAPRGADAGRRREGRRPRRAPGRRTGSTSATAPAARSGRISSSAPFTAESGLALRPVTVVEDATADNAGDGLRRDWPTAVGGVSVTTNYGYAVQWFAMSIAFLGLYVWLQFIRPRRLAAHADSDSPLDARVDDTASPMKPTPSDDPQATGPESLTFTLHGTPAPMRDYPAAQSRRGRITMLVILFACALPVVASYFTYYVVRPQGRTNYATLIEPQRPLPSLDQVPAQDLDGHSVPLTTLKGQWLLIVVAPAGCGKLCESNLFLQRQLREMMGAERDRIEKVWLVDSPEPVAPALAAAVAAKPSVATYRVERTALARWLEPEARPRWRTTSTSSTRSATG